MTTMSPFESVGTRHFSTPSSKVAAFIGLSKAFWATRPERRRPATNPRKLVFIDETGASTNLARKGGRCRRGRRLRVGIPHGHYKTVTLRRRPAPFRPRG